MTADEKFVEDVNWFMEIGDKFDNDTLDWEELTKEDQDRYSWLQCDEYTFVSRLISIIRKQQKALEKCKEQRDGWSEFYDMGNPQMGLDKQNKELEEILEA